MNLATDSLLLALALALTCGEPLSGIQRVDTLTGCPDPDWHYQLAARPIGGGQVGMEYEPGHAGELLLPYEIAGPEDLCARCVLKIAGINLPRTPWLVSRRPGEPDEQTPCPWDPE